MKSLIPTCCALLALTLTAAAAAQTTCRVTKPVRASSNLRSSLPGRLVADQQLSLRARVTGYVAEVKVDHGSRVARGDVLVRIDAPELVAEVALAEAALAEAQAAVINAEAGRQLARSKVAEAEGGVMVCAADLKLAQLNIERTKKLFDRGGSTQQALDEVQAQLTMATARGEVARATLATARAAVAAADAMLGSAKAGVDSREASLHAATTMAGFAQLLCPFETAIVTRRRVDPGALVKMNDTVLLELSRVDTLRAEFYVPERDAMHVHKGTKLNLTIDARGEGVIATEVSRTTGALSKSNKMIAQVDIDNRDGQLLPGMFVYASLLLESEDGVLTLPASALHTDAPDQHYVLVAADGVAEKVALTLKSDNGITVQIASGLIGDEQVIIAGLVKSGDAVRIQEASK